MPKSERSIIKRSVLSVLVAVIVGCIVPIDSTTADSRRDDRYYDDDHDHGKHRGHSNNRGYNKHRHEHTHTYSHRHPHGKSHDSREHGHRHYADRDQNHDDRSEYPDDDRRTGSNRPPKPPVPPGPWQIYKSVKPVYFSAMDKHYIKRYYRKTKRKAELLAPSAVPPGTEGRIKRGVIMPPAIGIRSLKSKLKSRLGALPSGYRYGLLGRVVIIYNKKTRVITDYNKVKL